MPIFFKSEDAQRAYNEKQFSAEKGGVDKSDVQYALSKASNFFAGGKVFTLVFAILLLHAVMRSLTGGGENYSFAGFLQFLTGAPAIPTDWISILTFDLGDWGVFQFLAEFIENFASLLRVASFFSISILNALLFILYFVVWIVIG